MTSDSAPSRFMPPKPLRDSISSRGQLVFGIELGYLGAVVDSFDALKGKGMARKCRSCCKKISPSTMDHRQ